MEQLQQELIRADLVERYDGGMAERRIGFVRHAAEIGIGNLTARERPDDINRDFPIGPSKEAGDGFARQNRPAFGHIQAAVAGEPGQHHITETESRGLSPGRNIPRQTALQRLKPLS
ncbi:hypothetical protein ACVJGD_005103 [Bradyrhizobium sp. USDA 10063]